MTTRQAVADRLRAGPAGTSSRALAGLTQAQLLIVTIGLFVFGFAWAGVPPWLPGTGSNAFTLFVPYLGYFVAGHSLARVPIGPRTVPIAAAVFVVLLVVSSIVTDVWVTADGLQNGRYLYGYLAPTVIGMSLCVFLLCARSASAGSAARRPPAPGTRAGCTSPARRPSASTCCTRCSSRSGSGIRPACRRATATTSRGGCRPRLPA